MNKKKGNVHTKDIKYRKDVQYGVNGKGTIGTR